MRPFEEKKAGTSADMIRESNKNLASRGLVFLLLFHNAVPAVYHLLVAELESTRVLIKQTETVPKLKETSLSTKSINI